MAITFEQVAAAAEALQSAGQRPSVRAVIAALPNGGSPNTVLKLLTDWKAGRPVVRIADTELDSRITDSIKTQMQRVAEQAALAAEERAAAALDDLQALSDAQSASEQQIAELITERDAAKAQSDDFVDQLKDSEAEN